MQQKEHQYQLNITWTGNTGSGTFDYRSYERSHIITAKNKPEIFASSDSAFRGDSARYNPEELLVASISSCHMLWFLHLCSQNQIVVIDYIDNPTGTMVENPDGSGHFKEVILRPVVKVSEAGMVDKTNALHEQAHKLCFIANSVNFPVKHVAECSEI
jgi:organic hydroperoxide reductase OsmC/OhrA